MDANSITPGFLSLSAASTLRETVQLAADNRRRLDLLPDITEDDFPAKLTGRTAESGSGSETYRFSWVEQRYTGTGERYDAVNGRTGDYDWQWAVAVGVGDGPDTFPVEVWLRRRLTTADYGPVYEFDAGGGGGAGDTEMTRVTTTADDEGLLTAYITEFGPGNTDTSDGEEILMLLL